MSGACNPQATKVQCGRSEVVAMSKRGKFVLAMIAAFVLFVLLPQARITRDNYYYIEKHMSRAQVEDILGPPRDCTSGPLQGFICIRHDRWPNGSEHRISEWSSDSACIEIAFDGSDRVVASRFSELRLPKGTGPDPVWLVKHMWNRWFA
jgi:hypothetical protein